MSTLTPKVLQKLDKLIALSGSDQIEEARTAAFMACKIIRDNEIRLGSFKEAGNAEPRVATQHTESQENKDNLPKPMMIIVKFNTKCRACGHLIQEGTPAYWVKGTGCYHPTCKDFI